MATWQPLPKARPARQQGLEQLGTSQTVSEFRASYASPETNGSIEVVDAAWCRVTEGGISRTVGRFCTHEGADLSCGYLQNGRLYCPFHHLHFDPVTGKAPHDGFKPLKVQGE
jgi:nitrite reductase/ring-hydroxylating ferredoxin subunit